MLRTFKEPDMYTIACCECKKPLWFVKIEEKYGTRWAAETLPAVGVPEYSEFWEKDGKTSKNNKCPHCGRDYFKAVPIMKGEEIQAVIAKFFIPELE